MRFCFVLFLLWPSDNSSGFLSLIEGCSSVQSTGHPDHTERVIISLAESYLSCINWSSVAYLGLLRVKIFGHNIFCHQI